MVLLVAFLLACSARGPAPEAEPVDDDAAPVGDTADARDDTGPGDPDDTAPDDAGDPDGDGLVGVRLDPPIDPFPFLVENQRREPRDPDWLVGDPSVVWFFRDAGST